MNAQYRLPILLPLVAFAIAVAHLAFEHVTGGVRSHHLLNRPDLPAISNWLGLVTLPLLGIALGVRLRRHASASRAPAAGSSAPGGTGVPYPMLAALVGAFLYGAALAAAFELGASSMTSAMFLGLFVCALALPLYRVEYMLGFVVGMTFTFGGVLPVFVALVVATVSFVVRFSARAVTTALRKGRRGNPSRTGRT